MRKFVLALAALGALGVAMPCAALADTVIIHKHRNHMPPPLVFHHHDNNKTVVIKHHDD